jgi:hypothetical protein
LRVGLSPNQFLRKLRPKNGCNTDPGIRVQCSPYRLIEKFLASKKSFS